MVRRMIAASGAMRSRIRTSAVPRQEHLEATLRLQHELRDFAHGATAARRSRDPVHSRTHLRHRVRHRCRKTNPRKYCKIGPIVTDVAAAQRVHAGIVQQVLEAGHLVARALQNTLDAEFACTHRHYLGLARSEYRYLDPALTQQLDAVTVAHVEGLHRLAARAVVKAPVGQHAVDVENHQANLCGALDRSHRILAAMRSCRCSAPTRWVPSTTSNWLRNVLSSRRAASAASASGPIDNGLRVITSATRKLRTSPTRSSRRRKSPSVKMPAVRPSSSTTAVIPIFLAVISCTASITLAVS